MFSGKYQQNDQKKDETKNVLLANNIHDWFSLNIWKNCK